MLDYIPFENLLVRGVYRLRARNLTYGVWTGNTFIGIREKFNAYFLDECEVPGSTAWAIEYISMLPEEVELKSRLDPVCDTCNTHVRYIQEECMWEHVLTSDYKHKVRPISYGYEPLFDYLTNLETTK